MRPSHRVQYRASPSEGNFSVRKSAFIFRRFASRISLFSISVRREGADRRPPPSVPISRQSLQPLFLLKPCLNGSYHGDEECRVCHQEEVYFISLHCEFSACSVIQAMKCVPPLLILGTHPMRLKPLINQQLQVLVVRLAFYSRR